MNTNVLWKSNMNVKMNVHNDVRSDYEGCPENNLCVQDGVACHFLIGFDESKRESEACCFHKHEQENIVIPEKKISFSPNRTSVVSCGKGASLREEVEAFEAFLREKGWKQGVPIGRYDDSRNIFDFRINLFLSKADILEIFMYFHKRGFPLNSYYSEMGAVNLLKEHIPDLVEYQAKS